MTGGLKASRPAPVPVVSQDAGVGQKLPKLACSLPKGMASSGGLYPPLGSGFLDGLAEVLEVGSGDLWGSGLRLQSRWGWARCERWGSHAGWARPSTGEQLPWGLKRWLLGLFPGFEGYCVVLTYYCRRGSCARP